MTAEIMRWLFLANCLLIIGDAALGYFVLPLVLPPSLREADEEKEAGGAVDGMRRLLTVMVLLSMLVNCYAFFQGHPTLLAVVTGLVLLDIILQLVLRRRRAGEGRGRGVE